MAVVRLPSFWDYLGQGAVGFTESLARKQQMDLLKAQEKRAETMFGYQAEPYELSRQIREAEANPRTGFFPNLLTGAGGGMTFQVPGKIFTESQYDVAGLKTPEVRQRERTKAATEEYKTSLELPVLETQAAQARAVGPGVAADVALERTKQLEPLVQKFADGYVAQQILEDAAKPKGTGRLQSKNLAALAAQAYAAFTADPERAASLGTQGISTDTLRPLFDKAVKAAWDKQREMDIESLRASAYAQGQIADKTPQYINSLVNTAKIFETRAKAMRSDPMFGPVTFPDPKTGKISAQGQTVLNKVAGLERIGNQLAAAATQLGAGTLGVEEAVRLLNDAATMMQAEEPQGEVKTEATQFPDDAVYQEAISKYAPSQWRRWLNNNVKAGVITQDQANRVLNRLERGAKVP